MYVIVIITICVLILILLYIYNSKYTYHIEKYDNLKCCPYDKTLNNKHLRRNSYPFYDRYYQ